MYHYRLGFLIVKSTPLFTSWHLQSAVVRALVGYGQTSPTFVLSLGIRRKAMSDDLLALFAL